MDVAKESLDKTAQAKFSELDIYRDLLFAIHELLVGLDELNRPVFYKPAARSEPLFVDGAITLSEILARYSEACVQEISQALSEGRNVAGGNHTARFRIVRAPHLTLLIVGDEKGTTATPTQLLQKSTIVVEPGGSLMDLGERKIIDNILHEAIRENVYEKLFIKLRAFRHGEGGAMCMWRIALLAENIPGTDGWGSHAERNENGWAAPLFKRFLSACKEYETLVYPEILRIASLLTISGEEQPGNDETDSSATGRLVRAANELNIALRLAPTIMTKGSAGEIAALCSQISKSLDAVQKQIESVTRDLTSRFTVLPGPIIQSLIEKYDLSSNGIEFTLDDQSAGVNSIGTLSVLNSVLNVLIENAITSLEKVQTRTGKYIAVRILAKCESIMIEVEDNGVGIPDDAEEEIFRRSYSTKTVRSGFGLPFARASLREFGGALTLRATADHGACFVIELPRP